jgi:hypothetical protein
MSSITDSTDQSNHLDDQQDNDVVVPSAIVPSDDHNSEEPIVTAESEETGNTNNEISETDTTSTTINSTNMVTAEASFIEATSADLPLGASRSSVARILVKPGQIFRVQVDNEVKEVHGKFILINKRKTKKNRNQLLIWIHIFYCLFDQIIKHIISFYLNKRNSHLH